MSSQHIPVSGDGGGGKTTAAMTAQEIDRALSAMADASAVLIREWEAEERRSAELNELNEACIEQSATGEGSRYDAASVLLNVRLSLAVASAKRHRDTTRDFVAWWADAATVTARATALGTPVQHARLVAAAPETLLGDDELAALPPVDEHTRQLVELAAFLGPPAPAQSAAEGRGEDLSVMAADLAARSGLRVQLDEAGEIEVVEANDSEARRCRLWGDFWVEHRIPALLSPEDWEGLSGRLPSDTGIRLRAATKAVVQAVVAGTRMNEFEEKEERWTAEDVNEYDELVAQWKKLTVLLADYARVVTESLPALRRAVGETVPPSGHDLPPSERRQAIE